MRELYTLDDNNTHDMKKKRTKKAPVHKSVRRTKAPQGGFIIKFGTDGWRGKIAEDYTFDNVRRCAQGFANYLKKKASAIELARGVVVGGDRRFNSEHFAAATAEILAALSPPAQ